MGDYGGGVEADAERSLTAVIIHPPHRCSSLPGSPRCMVITKLFDTVRPSGSLTGPEIDTAFDPTWPSDPGAVATRVTSKLVTTPSTPGSKTMVA